MATRDDAIQQGIVELDDTYLGKAKKRQKGQRDHEKQGCCRSLQGEDGKPKYVKMQVVTDIKEKTIAKFAKSSIANGTTEQTDAYRSYRKPLAEKYQHE